MAREGDWSPLEVEICVADYRHMLTLELNGQRYSKTEHANTLLKKLDGRSRASVEFKHCNISAVMTELGYPSIRGYKQRGNYQSLLRDVVEAQVEADALLQSAAQFAVLRPAIQIKVEQPDSIWVPAPKLAHVREVPPEYAPRFTPVRRDYLAQESRNRSLGNAGELFVVELESRRLHAAGKKELSKRVEHVAATQGDGLGYDVLSFEVSGRERLIEVKTTAFGELTPFFVSRNELARSETHTENYRLYRLFDFRNRPRAFELPGAIAARCQLEPVSYIARIS